ncbi:hypothetical protein [Bifidobacterium sp. SO4]|uniref:hypothetical protein n=1 Tax=Bifidobacterium sp. SO4 TaxID=2809030 RepID=UPI001BDC1E6C|nr:hypothetical protein [Bifidobacterium sp. SO4]MBT1171734.1 hypothetical protein [Bifidobacterium sp. SO4]
MTGNNKVWRAPLAGLASFAMIATMGVAAATANAATTPATVTFKVGNTTFEVGEEDLQTPATAVDGKIDKTELDQALNDFNTEYIGSKYRFNKTTGKWDNYTLTGFTDGSALQVVLTDSSQSTLTGNYLVNPNVALSGDVTLTARLQRDPYKVTFDTQNVTKGGVVSSGTTGSIFLAMSGDDTLDLVPSWAVPTTEVSAVDHLIAYKKDGKTMAGDAYWKTTGAQATIKDPTASSLYVDAFAVDTTNGSVKHDATLTLNAATATKFTFHTANAVRNDATNFSNIVDNENNPLGDRFNGEAATGETISDYLDFPTAVFNASTGVTQSSREWYARRADTVSQLDASQKWDDSQKAGEDVDLYAANATNSREVTLHYNATGVKDKVVYAGKDFSPETPDNVTITSVEYKFAGWYTDATFTHKFVGSSLGSSVSDLYAKWDIAAVRFWVDPNYNTETAKALWVNNGANFRVPVASDYRSGWTATVFPNIAAAGVDADGDGKADLQDNFNLYAVFDGNNGKATGSNVALKYQDKDGQHQLKNADTWADLVPGARFWFENWSKATVQDLNTTLDRMKSDVKVKNAAGQYIKGSDQDHFTAASWDQYVSDLQEFEKNNGTPKSVADYQSQISELAALQAKLVEVSDTYIYRAYNKRNGDHYFTAFKSVYDNLVKIGWNAEGSPYSAVAGTNLDGVKKTVTEKNGVYYRTSDGSRIFGQAVYSVYNRYTGEHLLTVSKTEADSLPNGWENEGVAFFAPQGATEDVYRSYNPYTKGPAHVYVGLKEYNNIAKAGWKGEDIVFKLNAGK